MDDSTIEIGKVSGPVNVGSVTQYSAGRDQTVVHGDQVGRDLIGGDAGTEVLAEIERLLTEVAGLRLTVGEHESVNAELTYIQNAALSDEPDGDAVGGHLAG